MIDELLPVLAAAGLRPTPHELRDALWLADQLWLPAPAQPPRPQPAPATPVRRITPAPAAKTESRPPVRAGTAEVVMEGSLYAVGTGGIGTKVRGVAVRERLAPALSRQIELTRALRPFARRVPSQTSFLVDEAATVSRIADEGIWLPVLRPAPDRWLDLALVVDSSPSMVLWRRTVLEFRRLLESLGAFRRVRVYATGERVDLSHRQAALVITDGVGGAWRDGRMAASLRTWGSAWPTAVMTVLPQRMWAGTGLRVVPARLRATAPGLANRHWACRTRAAGSGSGSAEVPIPVLTLSGSWLASWANVVGGAPDWHNAAVLVDPLPGAVDPPAGSLGAADLVRQFRAVASPTAFQLACYLSAAWLNPPVMRLVQRLMLPGSNTSHLSEVFLGGLLHAADPPGVTVDPELAHYDFVPGVRDELNNLLLRDDLLTVLSETSHFVADRFGLAFDFAAMLADPGGVPRSTTTTESSSPAQVAATVLAKLGGRYRVLADQGSTASTVVDEATGAGRSAVPSRAASRIVQPSPPAPGRTPPRPERTGAPKQLDPAEQDALVKQIGLAMLRAAPDYWVRVTIDYRAVGRYTEAEGEIGYDDDEVSVWPVPQQIIALFARLRVGMYREGRGTWFNATYRLDHPSSYNLDYDRDEPKWRQPPPPQAYADDLQTFPRTPDNIPEWLRRRLSNKPAPEPPSPLVVPRLLSNRYELGETLGRGDKSEISLARDLRLGRQVAVKVLRPDVMRDPQFQERFRREAQHAAALNHPAIVAVYDTSEINTEHGPLPYFVMEYVDGRTLRDIVKTEGPLPGQRAMEIIADVCAALDFSHRKGIVHCNLKPANVMLTRTGAVKLRGFGIAKLVGGGPELTETGAVIGTALYLSPEQAQGEPTDARSDVYAAGCVFFELLTGEPPFDGESAVAIAYQHLRENPRFPSTVNPRVSPSLDAVVLKAMAKTKEGRYQSAAELRTELVRVLSGQRPLAPPVDAEQTVPLPPWAPDIYAQYGYDRYDPYADEQRGWFARLFRRRRF